MDTKQQSFTGTSQIQLPNIVIPKFDVNFTDWTTNQDTLQHQAETTGETLIKPEQESFYTTNPIINIPTYNQDICDVDIYFDTEDVMHLKEPVLDDNTHRNLNEATVESNNHKTKSKISEFPNHLNPSHRDLDFNLHKHIRRKACNDSNVFRNATK